MKRLLKAILARFGYRVQGTRFTPRQLLDPGQVRSVEFDDVICRRIIETGPALTFLQIGAFDGLVQDPLRKYIVAHGWRGVMVEPQPAPARRLRELYAPNRDVEVVEVAIDRERGSRSLFTVQSEKAPAWVGALASFDRRTIAGHSDIVPGLEEMIVELSVKTVPFADVLARLPAGGLDVLQIDTEGADGYLLSLFPFEQIRPAIVHWEVRHLTIAEREACLDRLAAFGYRFAPSGTQDMLAVHQP